MAVGGEGGVGGGGGVGGWGGGGDNATTVLFSYRIRIGKSNQACQLQIKNTHQKNMFFMATPYHRLIIVNAKPVTGANAMMTCIRFTNGSLPPIKMQV